MTTEAKKRPGLAFIGWAVGTVAAASAANFLLNDVNHINSLLNEPKFHDVEIHLSLESIAEAALYCGAVLTAMAGGIQSICKLVEIAARSHNKRLAQPNA